MPSTARLTDDGSGMPMKVAPEKVPAAGEGRRERAELRAAEDIVDVKVRLSRVRARRSRNTPGR